jgi:hypothetical protein
MDAGIRRHWRDLLYWPWWWRNSVSSEAKTASAVLLALRHFSSGSSSPLG